MEQYWLTEIALGVRVWDFVGVGKKVWLLQLKDTNLWRQVLGTLDGANRNRND